MKAKGGSWSVDELNKFLTNPRDYIPGTAMTFAGLSRESQRADVIAYLNTLSDNPKPLPKAAASGARSRGSGAGRRGTQAGRAGSCGACEVTGPGEPSYYGRVFTRPFSFGKPEQKRWRGATPLAADRKTDIIPRDLCVIDRSWPRARRRSRATLRGWSTVMKLTRRSALRGSAAALAAPAIGALGAMPPARAAAAEDRQWKHGLSLFGDIKLSGRLQAFRLRQSGGAAGRHGAPDRVRHVRQFQRRGGGVKGSLAMGTELITESLVDAGAGRSVHRIRPAGGSRQLSGRPLLGHLSAARQCALARRQAGDARRRDLFLRHFQQEQPAIRRLLPARDEGGKDRRARDHLHLRRPRQSRTAADRRPIAGAAQALVGRHRQIRQEARRHADDAGAAARLPGLIASRISRPAAPSSTRSSPTIGARTSTSISAPTISRQIRYEYYRDSTVALEAFKGDQVDWRTENSAKNWATAYDFPAVRDKKVVMEEFPVRNVGVMQAFAFNIRRDKFKDPRVRRAFNFAFDFEEMNRQIFFGQYKRIASYFEGTELASFGPSRKARSWRSCKTVKDKVPADLFTQPYTNPVGGDAAEGARQSARSVALMREAGYEVQNTKLVNSKTNERLSGRAPGRRSVLRAGDAVLQAVAGTHGHRGLGAHRRQRAIREPDAAMGLRHRHRVLGRIAVARQRAARLLGLAGGRYSRLAQHGRHQESGGRRVDRARHLRQEPRGAGRRHARRSIACCCGITTSCRNGPIAEAAHRALGSLRPPAQYAEIRAARRSPSIWWWDADKAAKVPQRS